MRALLRREGPWALLAAFLAGAIALWVLRGWDITPTHPLDYDFDGLYHLGLVQGVLENAWYFENPRLGAPFGLEHYDFPLASNETLSLVAFKLVGLFFESASTVTNVFYLLTYPATALVAYAGFRALSVSRWTAVLVAVLFSLLPYHFIRGENHLFLANYVSVPLGAYLIMAVLSGRPLIRPRGMLIATVAMCVVIALSSVYYATFVLVLVALAGLLSVFLRRDREQLAGVAVVLAVVGALTLAQQVPTLVYRAGNGPNDLVAKRAPSDSETYGLKVTQLVLPVDGHRFDPFERLARKYSSSTPIPSEPTGNLGLLGSIGLLWGVLMALGAAVGGARRVREPNLEGQAGVAALLTILVGTVGGGSALIAYTATAQIRSWNRISVFVAFFALLALGLLLDRLTRSRRRGLVGAVVALLLVVGVLDETSPGFAPNYPAIAGQWASDGSFVQQIERRLPPGAAVFQLPYQPFPEGTSINRAVDYDSMRGYLHSKRLRWSYGAMKGRPEDWSASMVDKPLPVLLAGVAAAGFSGVTVDRAFFADPAPLERELSRLLGPRALTSAGGRLAYWDLRAPGRRQRGAAEATVRPIRTLRGAGFFGQEGAGQELWRWAQSRAEVTIVNPGPGARLAELRAELRSDVPGGVETLVRWPGGSTESIHVTSKAVAVGRRVRLRPGDTILRLETSGARIADPAGQVLQVRNPVVVDARLCRAARTPPEDCTRGPRPQLP